MKKTAITDLEQISSDTTIRKTADGRISVFDALRVCGAKNPADTLKRIQNEYPDEFGECELISFSQKSGRKGRGTPVAPWGQNHSRPDDHNRAELLGCGATGGDSID